MRICPQCSHKTEEQRCPHDGFRTVDMEVIDDAARYIGVEFEGRYRIDEVIREGGMGVVFKATDLQSDQEVAIKVLKRAVSKDLAVVARFQREARAIASLESPYVVKLLDFGQDSEGRFFLVMEYLSGETLGDRIERLGHLTEPQTVQIGMQVLSAMEQAHAQKIVHRDIKPDNIFLVAQPGGNDVVKVLDFGIAKFEGSEDVSLTQTGVTVGSPAYMSPEQATAEAIGPASDIYSLGAVLYEAVSGERVFERASHVATMLAHVNEKAPSLGERVSPELDDFLARCLQKSPADRPVPATAARGLLQACLPGEDEDGASTVDIKPIRRQRTRELVEMEPQGVETSTFAKASTAILPPHARRARNRRKWALVATVLAGIAALVWWTTRSREDENLHTAVNVDAQSEPSDLLVQSSATYPSVVLVNGAGEIPTASSTADNLLASSKTPIAHVNTQGTFAGQSLTNTALLGFQQLQLSNDKIQQKQNVESGLDVSSQTTKPPLETYRAEIIVWPRDARIYADGKSLGLGKASVSWQGEETPKIGVVRNNYKSSYFKLNANDADSVRRIKLKPKYQVRFN